MKQTPLNRGGGLRSGGISSNRKPINKYGRIAQERAERKREWEQAHPPLKREDGQKYYYCHICVYFGESMDIAYVAYERYVLEHVIPKGRLSFEESQEDANLAPSHVVCNNEKGSQLLCHMLKSPKSGLPNPHYESR